MEKLNITNEFSIFESVYVSNLIFIRQCCFLGSNLLQKDREMAVYEILCWLAHEILVCFTSHT